VRWRGDEFRRGCCLDNFAQVHDGDAVAHLANNGQIVRDEKISEAQAFAQVLQQQQHLCLNGNIQGGNRFIAHHQRRIERQSSRNSHALPLPAGKLVRIAVGQGRAQANSGQQVRGFFLTLVRGANAVNDQWLCHDGPHAHAGVER